MAVSSKDEGKHMRVAAIDCGTNTIRLLVADVEQGRGGVALRPVARDHEIVRLGQGVDRSGLLDEAALARTLDVVGRYAQVCQRLDAQRIRFVATSATRDAGNRGVFVNGVRERLGVEPEVVSGQEEARLSFAGAALCLSGAGGSPVGPGQTAAQTRPGQADVGYRLVVDLGGGSTELVVGDREPVAAYSMDTGSVRVTERYLAAGVTPEAERAARVHVRGWLDQAEETVDLSTVAQVVGVAGTITTVSAHALGLSTFDPERIHGSFLTLDAVRASCEAIIHSTARERESWGYLRPGRRDVIAAGALVWSEVLDRVVQRTAAGPHPVTGVTTSLTDILDGIALSLVPDEGEAGTVTGGTVR